MPRQVILASGNNKKLSELQAILQPLDWELLPQTTLQIPAAEETGSTFIENAIIKARQACHYGQRPAIADDSGLEVDALQGAPGVYSARFAGIHASDADNNRKLVELLSDVPDTQRHARYRAVLVFMRHEHDPAPLIAEGVWEGMIQLQAKGQYGFGYDPHFYIPSLKCTAAELSPEEKNTISHRAQAVSRLASQLTAQ